MAKYRIPPDDLDGFKLYINLDPNQRKTLIDLILSSKVSESKANIQKAMADRISLSSDELEEIWQTTQNLVNAYLYNQDAPATFLDEIEDSLENDSDPTIKLPEDLKEELLRLLTQPNAIRTNQKAIVLSRERENIVVESNVYTDARPVFDYERKSLEGYLILHNLKIVSYSKSQPLRGENYFALDKTDLKRLNQQIVRAEQKEKVLKEDLKGKIIEPNEDL